MSAFPYRCQMTCVKIFHYFITYIVYVIPVIIKNIWPVKTARRNIILYFIACQTVFYFVLRKSMATFCKHAAIKINRTPEYKIE